MRDLFDDFMEELRKREAAARGEEPAPDAPGAAATPTPIPTTADDDTDRDDDDADGRRRRRRPDADDRRRRRRRRRARCLQSTPVARRPARRRRQPPRRGRRAAPNDGGPAAAPRGPAGASGSTAIVIVVIAVFLLFSVGLDLWTDALWYASVGFDSVFWTRLAATLGLGVAAFLLAAVVLLGNLWLAGRLAPPPTARTAGSLRSLVRPHQRSAQAADDRRDPTRRRSAAGATGSARSPTPGRSSSRPATLPDLTPLAGWVLGGIALFIALLIGGLVSGAWETVLLWINRVPFSPTATRHRPDLRPRHRLLPVRAAVPAARPGPVQRPRRRGAAPDPRPLHRRRVARRPRLLDAGPGPPRRPRRAVPAVGRVRLPARQARARVQHPRRRDRRQLHRPERPVPRLRRPDRPLRDRRGPARRRRRSRGCSGRSG